MLEECPAIIEAPETGRIRHPVSRLVEDRRTDGEEGWLRITVGLISKLVLDNSLLVGGYHEHSWDKLL